jgi:hypothetical protein
MKRHLLSGVFFGMFILLTTSATPQVANDADGNFDSTSYVETDSTTNTTSNVTSNNTNTNTNTNNTTVDSTSTSTNTNNNNNVSTSTSTNTNNNNNVSTSTSTNTNNNNNVSTSTVNQTVNQNTTSTIDQTIDQTINQTTNSTINSTSNNTNTNVNTSTNTNTNDTTVNSTAVNTNNNNNRVDQRVESPPPSAIAPTIQSGGNDTCTVTFAGAVQTQVIGLSGGGHIRDMNCERLKNAKTLYNMGMKVAAVALMCQDSGVFEAMRMAGTPCPFMGEIGTDASALWEDNPSLMPEGVETVELAGGDNETTSDPHRRMPLRLSR